MERMRSERDEEGVKRGSLTDGTDREGDGGESEKVIDRSRR